jgi:hypothetical protein
VFPTVSLALIEVGRDPATTLITELDRIDPVLEGTLRQALSDEPFGRLLTRSSRRFK